MTPNEAARKILDTLPRSVAKIRKSVARVGGELGLTVTEIRVLRQVGRGITTATALANHHSISVPAMSRVIEGLLEKKLLLRRVEAKDRRKLQLTLSREGQRIDAKAVEAIQSKITCRLENLKTSELVVLGQALELITHLFEETEE
jgi:DNA-binding MarR family transcriptional regulator